MPKATFYGDVVISTGTYVKDGEEKKRWLKIGAAFQGDDGGIAIKLEALPISKGDGVCWIKIFKKDDQPRQQAQTTQQAPAPQQQPPPTTQPAPTQTQPAAQTGEDIDDIPF